MATSDRARQLLQLGEERRKKQQTTTQQTVASDSNTANSTAASTDRQKQLLQLGAERRQSQKSSNAGVEQQAWITKYNNLQKTLSGEYNTDEIMPTVQSLVSDYRQMRQKYGDTDFGDDMYSSYIGLLSMQERDKDLKRWQKEQGEIASARAQQASGILPDEAEAMRQEREQLQAELDAYLASGEADEAMKGNAWLHAFGTSPFAQSAEDSKRTELEEKIAAIDAQLNLYDRTDGFRDTRITPLKTQEGFATSRQDFQNNNAARVAGIQNQIDNYSYDWTDTNQRKQAETDITNLENEKTDELGEYLTWWEGLSAENQQALLDGNLNAQAAKNRELVLSTPRTVRKHWERMTEDEINAYYYIANTEGMTAAKEYLDDLQVVLDKRHTEGREEAIQEQMAESPTWANALRGAATVGGNVVAGPMAFASDVINAAQGDAFNPYSNAHYLQNVIGVTRSAAANEIQQSIAGDGSSKFWNGVGEVAANAYQAGLSTLDSLAGMTTMGSAYTVSMGMGAASSRMRELYESGATDQEIYVGAIGSGILEALFEKVSLEYFTEGFIKSNPEKWIKKAMLQAGVEGSEEFFTEISNLMLDAVNRGVNSDHSQRVRELMNDPENPLSREEAQRQAVKEDVMDVFWAFLGGVMSGGMSSVGGAVIDSTRQNQMGQDVISRNVQEDVIKEALELREGDELGTALKAKQDEGSLGKKHSDATKLGRLVEKNIATMTAKDMEAVTHGVEVRLKEEGTKVRDPQATAEAIVKSLAGESLGVSDRFYLAINEKYVDQVKDEIYSVADGSTANNKWVQSIGTYTFAPGTFGENKTHVQQEGMEAMKKTVKETFGSYSDMVMRMYRPQQNRMDFVAEVKQLYQAGMDGVPLEKVPETKTLDKWQREAAWDMGQGKSEYDYDNNQGFAKIKGETVPINIVGVAASGKGQLVLRTDDGSTVYAGDVTFGSYSESKLYSVISLMGVNATTANEIVSMSRESQLDLNEFSRAMQDAFYAGRNGIPFSDIQGDRMAMKLPREQRELGWKAGRAAARQRAAQRNQRVQQGKHLNLRNELKMERSAQKIKSLNKQQKAGMGAARVLSAMGLNITVYASTEEQRAKGMENGNIRLSDGSIRIDLNAGDSGEGVMAWALSHEFTHFVEEMTPEKFQLFQELLFEELGRDGQDVAALIEQKVAVLGTQKNFRELSEDRLMEIATSEVVAEMMEPMLTDTEAIGRISDKLRQQDKGLWEKIKDWITGLVEKLKTAYKDLTPGSAIAQQTREVVTQSEEILNAWVDVASDAIGNYNLQEGQKNNAPEGVKNLYSVRTSFGLELQNWFDNTTHEERLKSGKRFLVGTTTDVLMSIGVRDYSIYFGGSKIEKILTGNSSMTLDVIKQAVMLLERPVLVMQSQTVEDSIVLFGDVYTDSGKPVMISLLLNPKTKSGEVLNYAVITSSYGRRSSNIQNLIDKSQIYYISDEENRTENWLQALGLHLPSAVTEFGSIANVPQTYGDVNQKDFLYSSRNAEDSEGNRLTQEQVKYFANSQVRDEAGKLIPVYHRTDGDFFTFRRNELGKNALGNATDASLAATSLVGHWFSDHDIGNAMGGTSVKSYLNIQNPYEVTLDGLAEEIAQWSEDYDKMQEHYELGQYNMVKQAAGDFVKWMKQQGYDGLVVEDREFGGTSYVILNSRQAKLTTNETPTGRNDIRFSQRTMTQLERENEKLRRDKEYLKELVKIQRTGNKDMVPTRASVNKAAEALKKEAGAKGSTQELAGILEKFYREIGKQGDEAAQMGLADQAAEWLVDHQPVERDAYSQEVLDWLKKRHVALSQTQVDEVKYQFGSIREFQSAIKGSIIIDSESNTDLDQLWKEAAADFPGTFDINMNEGDMPGAFAELVETLKNSKSEDSLENQYYREQLQEELVQKVYLSLANIEPVGSVSDQMRQELRALQEQKKQSDKELQELRRGTEKLRADKTKLEEQLKIQKEGNKDFVPTRRSVNQQARSLMEQTGAKGNQKEFADLLEDYYRQKGKRKQSDATGEKLIKAAAWLGDHGGTGNLIERISRSADELTPVDSVADRLKEQKAKTATAEAETRTTLKAMQDIRKAALDSYRKQQTTADKNLRSLYEKQYRLVMDDYQKQLEAAEASDKAKEKVEGWRKTEERGKLQKTLGTLNKMMLNPTRTAFVPDSLQPAVIKAMEVLNDYRLAEQPDMAQIRALHAELEDLMMEGARKNEKRIRQIHRQLDKLQGDYGSVQDTLTELKRMYAELIDSNEGKVAQMYDEGVESLIADAIQAIKGTEYGDLSVKQLEALNNAYAAILHKVRTANQTFAYGKKESISELAQKAGGEFRRQKDREKLSGEKAGALEKFSWNNLKPEYAFIRMGSQTMTTLYHNLRKGEDTFYNDISDARAFAVGAMNRNGYQNWTDKVIEYESVDGKKFSLNLEERMSLYAYSRRMQAIEHLTKGGIVLNENTKRTVKGLFGIKTEKVFHDYNNYRLSVETIAAIGDSLTAQQRAFVEEMQQYLSTVCADKNNEISRALYGVSTAKEKYYWPLKVSNLFSERVRNQQQNPGNRQKNAGHMKATTPHANNPVEVAGFMETWGNHVNNTAMYHAFTLPMEDFLRVYNFNSTEGVTDESIIQLITKKHGKGAVEYVDQLLKDLNQGVRSDPRESIASSLTSKFKKGAVSASLSVAIQQPSAIGRAFSVIDFKYFNLADMRYYATSLAGEKAENTQKLWEKMKKYAPVVGIKEMGRFDVNMGASTVDFITGAGETGFMAAVDKASGYLPEKMDQATWIMIWNAAERQCKAKGYIGEALNKATGELFTECITKTQVYDSVFSRSGNMRSKSLYMNMATSFMAEPTTTANMFLDAMADAKNGDWKTAGRKVSSIAAATILNALLASVVYAARDDDEDSPYQEKYLKSLTSELVDSFNPMGYVPIAKDIWSMLQGYDVDRADMTLWSEAATMLNRLKSAYEAMGELDEEDADYEESYADAKKKVAEAWGNAVGAICNLFGVPAKNLLREIRAIVNTWETVSEDRAADWETAKYGMWEAFQENLPEVIRQEDSKSEQLYKAMESGSKVWIDRMKESYSGEKAFETAVKGSLRDNDKRIRKAAKMLSENEDPTEYKNLVQEMVEEGHFTEEQILAAIQAEAVTIKGEFADYSAKTVEKFIDLYADDLLDAQQFTDFWEYKSAEDEDGKKLHNKDEMIVYIGSLKVTSKAKDALYNLLGYSADALENMPWHSSGYSIWEARVDNPALADYSDTAVEKFLEIRNNQITVGVYTMVYEYKHAKDDDGKSLHDQTEVMAFIDSLNLSQKNKDELLLAMGYKESALKKAPWN